MLGAIIGDIAGSRFEWHSHKSKDFELFGRGCGPTDDSIMTIAVAKAVMECKKACEDIDPEELAVKARKYMREIGRHYPHCGFGRHFKEWLFSDLPDAYGSYGNGAAMRVSAAGDVATSIYEAQAFATAVTAVSHDHPEAIKAAVAVSSAIFMARSGQSMEEIRDYITENYYDINFTLDEIRPGYKFDVSCQGSVPQAFQAFFESTGFEDAIRNAISIGGDSDTIAAITGSIAEAYYGIPGDIADRAIGKLNHHLRAIVQEFYISGIIR